LKLETKSSLKKILIIQTAFIGDVILVTPIIERLRVLYPEAAIDFMLRKGNEGLLKGHPYINKLIIWDKKQGKYSSLFKLWKEIKAEKYDVVINLQRFGATGLLTALSGAKIKVGFDKNPFSFAYTYKVKHQLSNGKHEVDRNLDLLSVACFQLPDNDQRTTVNEIKLYPSDSDYTSVLDYKIEPYICIAPTSVWFTKQYPPSKWVELLDNLDTKYKVYLLGAPGDNEACDAIITASTNKSVENLAGKLNFLQSAALMKDAVMNYVNDSAPMHVASAMNAPTTAIFCSTILAFGFGPLADNSKVVETNIDLACRPCGLHGHKACPEGHFKCAYTIEVQDLLNRIK
jgi:ADP-heptose:LPS heptosyltransferase